MGTPSGEATPLFSFLRTISLGVNSERKELIPLGANSFFKSRPYFERDSLSRKASRKSQKLFPFIKMIENHVGVLIHLKLAC